MVLNTYTLYFPVYSNVIKRIDNEEHIEVKTIQLYRSQSWLRFPHEVQEPEERGVVRRGPVRTAAVLVPPRRRRPRAGRDGAAPEGLRRRFRIAASGMTTFCTCKILL